MKLILASGSPRRRELLAMLDIVFRVDTSRPVEETVPAGMAPEEVPAYLSRLKAGPYTATLAPRRSPRHGRYGCDTRRRGDRQAP